MKKNDGEFSVPTRQSYVAIIMILFKTINIVFRQLIPVLVVILLGGSEKFDYILWVISVIALLSMIYAIVNFFRTYFYIQDDELVMHTGVFSHKKTIIPLERIQSVNFEQNIVHQIFDVLKLNIDTAGTEKNEFQFQAIDARKAKRLREIIMAGKKVSTGIALNTFDENQPNKSAYKEILSLGFTDLLKIGLTENHIRSGGLIFVFFLWIYQNLQEAGLDVDEYSEEIPEWEWGINSIVLIVFVFLMISILISLGRTVIKYFDLQFLRFDNGFKIVSGIFTKKEVSAQDHKIQFISWSDNLLRKIIGYKNLKLHQTKASKANKSQLIQIPGCKAHHIQDVVDTIFDNKDINEIEVERVSFFYFKRFAMIWTGIITIVGLILLWFELYNQMWILTGLVIMMIIGRFLSYRKIAYGHDGQLLVLKGGIFGDKNTILPLYKVQTVKIYETPFLRKKSLCTLILQTASGQITIPYLPSESGRNLGDFILYKIESTHRKWM